MKKSCAVHLRLKSNEMEAKWIFPFMPVAIAFILLRAETTAAASNMSISYQGCNQNKTCLSTPDKCDPAASSSCFFLSAGWPLNSTNITFELSGQSSGYIAVAFSVNNQMGNDSNIYACASDSGGLKLIHTTPSNSSTPILVNSSSEALVGGSVNGPTIQCVFTVIGLNVLIVNSQLNKYNMFLISGNFTNGTLGTPVIKFSTNSSELYTALLISTALGANKTTTLRDNSTSSSSTTTTTTKNNNTTNNNNTTTINSNNTNNNNTTTTNNTTTNNTTTTTNNTNNNNTTTTNNNTTTNNTTTTTNNTTTTTNNTNNNNTTTTNNNTTTTTNNNTTTNNTTNNNTTTNNTTTTNNNNTTNTTNTTTTTTTTTNNNNNNSGGSSSTGNNALQSTSAKAPLILLGAIVVALLSG